MRASAFYLSYFFTLAVYLPFLNLYFRSRGFSGWQIGMLSALMPAASFLAVPAITMLADQRGWRVKLLTASVMGTSAALILFLIPSTFAPLVVVMVLFSMAFSSIAPLADTTIVGMAVRHELNYGNFRLWGSLGFAVSATVCGVLWQRSGYRPMFVVAACCSLLVGVISLSLEDSPPGELRKARPPIRNITGDRLLVGILIATFLAASAVGMEFSFAGIYMSELGGSGLFVGMLFGVSALFELPGMRFSARLASRIGPGNSLVLAYGLLTAAYLGYALAPTPLVMLAFSFLRGLGYGLFYVGTIHFLNQRAPHGWSATVQGIMNATAYGAGQLISRPLAGRIFDSFGPRALYGVCAAIAVGAALVMVTVVGSKGRTSNDEEAVNVLAPAGPAETPITRTRDDIGRFAGCPPGRGAASWPDTAR